MALIKKDHKFTPRLALSIRNKKTGEIAQTTPPEADGNLIKASVSLEDCHENFWRLISFLQSLRDIETSNEDFSLVSQSEGEIVSALRGRDVNSIVAIIKQLSSSEGVFLTHNDVNQLLKRKERLSEFEEALTSHSDEENWWQGFFERNKWIFGYGLNYQILRHEQSQPHYGGVGIDGQGGQKGDYLTSTTGQIHFTVLVEIKTPETPLLQGSKEIRNGAWSLSKSLTDSLVQIEANIDTWYKQGANQPHNRDRFEKEGIYTVRPKGIIVIGHLGEIKNDRNKRETFERFRRSIHGVEIITFDELYARAKFIVEESKFSP